MITDAVERLSLDVDPSLVASVEVVLVDALCRNVMAVVRKELCVREGVYVDGWVAHTTELARHLFGHREYVKRPLWCALMLFAV